MKTCFHCGTELTDDVPAPVSKQPLCGTCYRSVVAHAVEKRIEYLDERVKWYRDQGYENMANQYECVRSELSNFLQYLKGEESFEYV